MLMGLKVAIRDDVRDRTNEEAMYFYTASPAMITFVVQAVVVVAISYMDGGIFIRLDLKGWLFVFAGVVAFIAWLKFPTYLARRFDSELKRPNKPVQTRPTSRPV